MFGRSGVAPAVLQTAPLLPIFWFTNHWQSKNYYLNRHYICLEGCQLSFVGWSVGWLPNYLVGGLIYISRELKQYQNLVGINYDDDENDDNDDEDDDDYDDDDDDNNEVVSKSSLLKDDDIWSSTTLKMDYPWHTSVYNHLFPVLWWSVLITSSVGVLRHMVPQNIIPGNVKLVYLKLFYGMHVPALSF